MKASTVAVTALLLTACSGQGGSDNATGSASGSGGSGATIRLQPGQWESRVEVVRVSAPNMPPGVEMPHMAPVTASFCMTPEQAAGPNGGVMAGNDMAGTGCTTENFSMAGGRITGTVQCNMQGTTSRTTMDGQFSPTSYEMTMVAQTNAGGVATENETRITARRTGDCPAG
jgi:hypothetical protein